MANTTTTAKAPPAKAAAQKAPNTQKPDAGKGRNPGGPPPPEGVNLPALFATGKVPKGVTLPKPDEAVTGLVIDVTGLCFDRGFYDTADFGGAKRDPSTKKIYIDAVGGVNMHASLADMGANALRVAAKAVEHPKGGPQKIHLDATVADFIQAANAWKQSWFLQEQKVYAFEEGEEGPAALVKMGS